jgi:hypothetical protein
MSDFKNEINDLLKKHKKELETFVSIYLNTNFKEFFEKNPTVISVKINCEQSFNDNNFYDHVYNDRESIKINGYNYMDLDFKDWENDEMLHNIGLTRDQHETFANEAAVLFSQIPNSVFVHIYGNNFGLKIDRLGITLETSDI